MMRVIAVYLLLLVSFCDQACCDDLPEDDTDDENNDRTFSPAVPPRTVTTAPVHEGGGRGRSSSDSADHLTTSGESHGSRCAWYDDNPSASTRRIELSKRLYSPETRKVAEDGIVFYSNMTTLCTSFCFTLWVADPRNKSRATVSKQDCWQTPEGKDCLPNHCISDGPPRQNNTHFCCCSGHMCNVRFKDVYNPSEYTSTITQATQVAYGLLPDHSYKNKTIIIALVSVVSVSIATVILYLGYRLCLATKPSSPQVSLVARLETPEPLLPVFNVDDLKIGDVLVRGRYSEVRRGQLADKEVAVKIYQSHYRQYYYNERNAFTQPFMEHENLVKFYGAKEQEEPETNVLQYTIVTEYTPLGSLTGYLKNNTVDWYTLCHMCQGVARGLAHLHTDIQKGDLFKPAIAHRDVNTRNILVKPDLTCVIVDLGFSVGMIGSRIIKNGVAENAEQATLADVGTLRYMAPEVFDGAVNLRDCEASLKQIDVYALGLVIWEIASRCVDLYQGAPVPEYQLPFQAEAGLHPAFEEMQVLVVKYKTRPKFPEVWKDANPAVRSLKETIEDCWDTDAEARLTSLCVQERIADMSALWIHGSKHRGVTPTLNATINLPEGGLNTVNHSSSNAVVSNGVTYIPSFVDRNNEANSETGAALRDREEANSVVIMDNGRPRGYVETCKSNDNIVSATGPHFSNVHHLYSSSSSFDADDGRVRSWLQDQSLSESTVDTILPPTPSLEGNAAGFHSHANSSITAHATTDPPHIKANNVIIAKHKAVILHPNQGRNPTVERNTHKRSDEELAVSGNILVGPGEHQGGSTNTDRNNRRISLSAQSAPSNRNIDGGSFDGLETIESSSLMQNDSLGQNYIHPRNMPIPYFQNHVHSESAGVVVTSHLTRPKLANINGNKNLYLRLQGEDSNSRLNTSSGQISEKEAKSLKHKLSKLIRPKDFGSKLTHFVFGGVHKKSCAAQVTAGVTDVESAAGRSEGINRTSGQYINSGLDASPVSRGTANITAPAPASLAMEVQIVNGSIVTQAVSDAGNTQAHQNTSTIIGPPQGRLSATNVMRLGVLANPSTEELPSPSLFPKSGSESSAPNCLFGVEPEYAVPLQNLVVARSFKDYGSMHPVIVNQAYGLESKEEVSSGSDLNFLSTSFKTPDLILTNESHEPDEGLKSPGNERSDLVNASSNNHHHHPNTLAESHTALTSDTSGSEKWKHNGPASFTAHDPMLVYSCNPDVLNHIVQSPQNKSIGSLNSLTACSSSLHGSAPNTLVNKRIAENLSHNLSYSQAQPTPLNIHHYHHHTDTKGGNSIMHYNLDKNTHHKEQQPHRSNLWDKKSAQHQPIKSHPEKGAANTFRQPQTQLSGDKTEGVVASSQSVLGVAQPRNAAYLEQHSPQLPTTIAAGKTDSQTGKSRKSRSSPIWQEGASHENLPFSKKTRPQSLSLRGHNYNRSKRGRSVSSSSLSSASLHHSAETNVKLHVKENYENGPLTFAVPNVTLDKSSPLIENSKNMEWKPATVPITSVAVSVTSSTCTGTTSSSSLCDSHMTKCSATIDETVGHVTKNSAATVDHVTKSNDTIGGTVIHVTKSSDVIGGTISQVIKSNAAIGGTVRDSDKSLGNNSAVTDDNADSNTTTRKHLIFKQQSDSSEKIRKRIKTPVSFKKGRLSLYDDRLMTQSLGFVSLSDMDQGSMYGGPGDDNNNGGRGGSDGGMERGRDDYYKLIKSESDLVL